jgi:hypothetical protein
MNGIEIVTKILLPVIGGLILVVGFISKYYIDKEKLRKEFRNDIDLLKKEIKDDIHELKKEDIKNLKNEIIELSRAFETIKTEFSTIKFNDSLQNDMMKSFNNNILEIIPKSIDDSIKKMF